MVLVVFEGVMFFWCFFLVVCLMFLLMSLVFFLLAIEEHGGDQNPTFLVQFFLTSDKRSQVVSCFWS